MTQGFGVSLALHVLGLIYHSIGTFGIHPKGPRLANTSLPIHYVVRWLGEHTPEVFTCQPNNYFLEHCHFVARYTKIEAKYVSSSLARVICIIEYVVYCLSVFLEYKGCTF